MRFVRTTLIGCVVLLAATVAVAQTGGLEVSVTDSEGLPLPGATVTISNKLGYVKTTTEVSDRNGVVLFPVLRPGEGYSIQVSFPGFSPIRYDDVRVKLSSTVPLKVQMIEEFQENVKVVAESDVVDLDKTESSTRFSDDFISDLPVPGRFYQNVLTMAPGVQDADGDGNPNVHGSRSRDFQAVVGNVSNVDPLTGQWLSRINTNSIEEMEVITAGAGVEFGRAQGGFARIIQKQGSNTHEGVVEVYWRTSRLDGVGANDTNDLPDPKYDSWQPGFQFSGPLVKDKLWYRASYELIDDEQPVNVLSGIELYERQRETIDLQATWQISPRNKVAFQFRSDPDEQRNQGVSSTVPGESTRSLDRDVETWTINWTAPYSPKVLVESTFAWQDINRLVGPTEAGLRNDCVPNASQSFINGAYCNDLERGLVSGSWYRTDDDHRQRFTVKGQATVYGGRFWGMTHQFKLGINVENERYFRSLIDLPLISFQVVSFGNDEDVEDDPDAEPSLDEFGVINAFLSVPEEDDVRATGTAWAFYAEDQFKPTQDLTITVGARLDREEMSSGGRQPFDGASNPSAELQAYTDFRNAGGQEGGYINFFTGYENIDAFKGQLIDALCEGVDNFQNCALEVGASVTDQEEQSLTKKRKAENINISNTNISPFVSVGWSPFADGKTAFKFTAGRYYNNLPLNIPLQELEPAEVVIDYRSSLIAEENCPDPDDLPPDAPPPEVACGQVELQGSIEPRLTVRTVDRTLSTPYQDEFTLKVERELFAETSVSLTYINRKFRDQIQDENINLANGDLGRCQRQSSLDIQPIVESPGMTNGVCTSTFDAGAGIAQECVIGQPSTWPAGCGSCSHEPYRIDAASAALFCQTAGVGDPLNGECLSNESPFGNSCTPGDPYCGVAYPDMDAGAGDGFIDPVVLDRFGPDSAGMDNCVGGWQSVNTSSQGDDTGCGPDDPFCSNVILLRQPDEAPDLYLQNPFWADILLIGNFNQIDYEAYVLELVRRQYRSWEMNASYTWSEATGDGEDFFQNLGNDPTNRNNLFGFQSYDQTHVVKLNATTITPWGFRMGTSVTWQSGLPYSLVLQDRSFDTAPPIINPAFLELTSRQRQTYITSSGSPSGAVRNSERNDGYWNVDLNVKKEMRLGKGMTLALSAEIFNVLDDDTYQIYNNSPLIARGQQVNGINEAFRRFGRSWQLGARMAF